MPTMTEKQLDGHGPKTSVNEVVKNKNKKGSMSQSEDREETAPKIQSNNQAALMKEKDDETSAKKSRKVVSNKPNTTVKSPTRIPKINKNQSHVEHGSADEVINDLKQENSDLAARIHVLEKMHSGESSSPGGAAKKANAVSTALNSNDLQKSKDNDLDISKMKNHSDTDPIVKSQIDTLRSESRGLINERDNYKRMLDEVTHKLKSEVKVNDKLMKEIDTLSIKLTEATGKKYDLNALLAAISKDRAEDNINSTTTSAMSPTIGRKAAKEVVAKKTEVKKQVNVKKPVDLSIKEPNISAVIKKPAKDLTAEIKGKADDALKNAQIVKSPKVIAPKDSWLKEKKPEAVKAEEAATSPKVDLKAAKPDHILSDGAEEKIKKLKDGFKDLNVIPAEEGPKFVKSEKKKVSTTSSPVDEEKVDSASPPISPILSRKDTKKEKEVTIVSNIKEFSSPKLTRKSSKITAVLDMDATVITSTLEQATEPISPKLVRKDTRASEIVSGSQDTPASMSPASTLRRKQPTINEGSAPSRIVRKNTNDSVGRPDLKLESAKSGDDLSSSMEEKLENSASSGLKARPEKEDKKSQKIVIKTEEQIAMEALPTLPKRIVLIAPEDGEKKGCC